jgi:hypothetical protein
MSMSRIAQVELATRLEPDDEEKEGHQAAVDPLAQRQVNARLAEREGHGHVPDLLV